MAVPKLGAVKQYSLLNNWLPCCQVCFYSGELLEWLDWSLPKGSRCQAQYLVETRYRSSPDHQWSCSRAARELLLTYDLGHSSSLSRNNDPEHSAKILKEWLQDNSVDVLEWPSQRSDLINLWRDLKMALHPCFPSNLMEFERCFKEEACGVIFKKN